MVLPKPPFTDLIISGSGIPENNPKPMAASNNAINGCNLNFVVEITMNKILTSKRTTNISRLFF
jgi:hypothetical protein